MVISWELSRPVANVQPMTVDRAADPHIGVQSRLLGNRSKTQMGKNSPSIDLSHGENINPTTSKNILWYSVKPVSSDLVTSGHPSVEICLPVMEHHLYSWYTLQSFKLAKENPPCTCRVGKILPVLHPLDISLLWLTIHNFWLILPCLRLKPI